MRRLFRAATLVSLAVASCALARSAEPPVDLAIEHVDVIALEPPRVLRDCTVLVSGERIARVAPASEVAVPDGAHVVRGEGRYLIAGLADMHEHLPRGEGVGEPSLEAYFALQLAAGVTTIRSMRGADGDVELRRAILRGERDGPRLLLGSPGVDDGLATDPDAARALVRRFQGEGYDFVKLLGGFDRATYDALADEARALGMPLAGHLPADVPLDVALEDFWTLEHLHGHGGAAERDPDGFAELARRTAESGVWVCPKLGFQASWFAALGEDELLAWPGMEHARADFVRWSRKGFAERASADAETRARWSGSYRARELAVRAFADAGVGLLASASGGWFLVPGFSLHAELECLAGAGLTPAEILTAATANAARSVGKENEWGSVREGLAADLVLLDANPFEDVRNALRIAAVVRRGELYDRAALDRLLAVADAER